MKSLLFLVSFVLSGFIPLFSYAQTTCTGQLRTNIVSNGDFGTGIATILNFDPLYAPNYVYQQSTTLSEGQYTIANTSQLSNNNCWIGTGDNSSDINGYFMLVNTASNTDIFYQRTLEVCDGIDYLLSIDFINLMLNGCDQQASIPNIDLLVDGQVVLQCGDLIEDENWHTYSQLISIPEGADLITITLRNNTSGTSGNDIGIDNISLQHCGPEIILPVTSLVCQTGGSISVSTPAVFYLNPYYQWQQSFDGGFIWQHMNGEQGSILSINNPNTGIYYRVLVANGAVNFQSESCRVTSNATRLEVINPIEVFITPVICEGDSVRVGNDILTLAGDYSISISGNSGCDSLIHTLLFTNPTYDHWFSQSLCSGDAFLGQTFNVDTILERSFLSQDGCDSIIHYEINVFSAENLTINGETQLCEGDTSTLGTSAVYPEYHWNTGESTSSISVSQAGEYSLSVRNAQGCESSTTISVQASAPFMETIADDPTCLDFNDGQIEVLFYDGGFTPYSFSLDSESWSNESLFTDLSSGEYTIFLKDGFGCEIDQSLIINEAEGIGIELIGLPETGIEAGDSVQLQIISLEPDLSYSWSGDGLFSCQNCPTVEWLPFSNGQLHVEVESSTGCSQIIDTSILVLEPLRVFIPNVFSPNGDGNNDTFFPATGTNVKAIQNWSVFDRWGGQMFEQDNRSPNDPALGWDGKWRGELQANGVYLYRAEITFNNGRTKIFAGEVTLSR